MTSFFEDAASATWDMGGDLLRGLFRGPGPMIERIDMGDELLAELPAEAHWSREDVELTAEERRRKSIW